MPRDPERLNEPAPNPPDPLVLALRQLEPAPAELQRDRLMFSAGAASRSSVIRLWQLTAGFMAAIGFAAGIYSRSPSTVDQVVHTDSDSRGSAVSSLPSSGPPAPSLPTPPTARTSEPAHTLPNLPPTADSAGSSLAEYLQIRREILLGGLDALPERVQPASPPVHESDPFQE